MPSYHIDSTEEETETQRGDFHSGCKGINGKSGV